MTRSGKEVRPAVLVTIGQFSKICLLSIKALRLYDELELLEPAFIDPRTNYRYYEPAQASRARAIALLRALNMPLTDIKEVLAESDPDKLRDRLDSHRRVLESRVRQEEHMLRRVEQLMRRGELMSYEMKVKEFEPVKVLGVTFDTSPEKINPDATRSYRDLYDFLNQAGVTAAAPPRLAYHSMDDETWRIECCVPVPFEPDGHEGFEFRDFPGGRVATSVHRGPYDELGIAWQELSRWITAHGHRSAGVCFDIYLNDPAGVSDPAEYVTELVWPIR